MFYIERIREHPKVDGMHNLVGNIINLQKPTRIFEQKLIHIHLCWFVVMIAIKLISWLVVPSKIVTRAKTASLKREIRVSAPLRNWLLSRETAAAYYTLEPC